MLFTPHWPDAPATIGALATGRSGGVSAAPYDDGAGHGGFNLGVHVGDAPAHVARNRQLLQRALPAPAAWLTQVHGVAVRDAATVGADAPQADASFSQTRGTVCAILTADCLPVLFSDAKGTVVAAAHAGWRGLAGGVLSATMAAMRAAGAGEIVAWLGPAIGAQQFEVGAEVLRTFEASVGVAQRGAVRAAFVAIPQRPGKYLADIYALARVVLQGEGVSSIAGGDRCTVSETSCFYSYRRDGITGRQATLIWRK